MQLVTVFRSFSAAEAQLVCSRLQAAGLDANVIHELAALAMDGYSMAAGGILVQVPDDQVEDAKALISSADQPEE